jgi:hypothetical protein
MTGADGEGKRTAIHDRFREAVYGGRRDDRAVSDTISFVLVFALIVSGVGLVTVFGMSSLADVKGGANADAAERGFVTLAENVDELEGSRSPVRTGDLSLADASLAVTTGPSLAVDVGGSSVSETVQVGGLEYRTGDTVVSYVGGGVFRTQDGGTAVVSSPSVRCTADHATVSVVRLTALDATSVGGGTAQVGVVRDDSALVFPRTRAPQTVTNVSVTTADPRWHRYFESQPSWTATGPDTYTCSTDRVFVRRTNVSVALE